MGEGGFELMGNGDQGFATHSSSEMFRAVACISAGQDPFCHYVFLSADNGWSSEVAEMTPWSSD